MLSMKTTHIIKSFSLLLIIVCLCVIDLSAQCPMCKMAAESNLDHGGSAGAGLNTGILFMLSMPYLIVACLGFIWFKNRNRPEDEFIQDVEELLNEAG